MDLAATAQDGVAHRLDDMRQLVAAYVGMGINQNFFAGAMLHKNAENTLHRAAFLAAGVEFAITVGSRPTLAEAVV